jgi:hypothetical protein
MISNLWKNPKTTVVGIMLGVVQVGTVLLHAGVVANPWLGVSVGIATALLGSLAKDPGATSSAPIPNPSTAKLGAIAMIALLLSGTVTGCTGASVAQNIVNWTPTLESAVATVDSTASVLDPASAAIFAVATAGFDAGSNLLVAQAKAYLANPGATTLGALQAQVVALQQNVNAALLSAAKISNTVSQQKALADINAVATCVTAILALVQSVSSNTAVARMASQSTVKLAQIEPYSSFTQSTRIVSDHYGETVAVAALDVTIAQARLQGAGF